MRYRSFFYPMRLALLCVERNFLPIAWWTPVSKAPFRMLLAIDRKNHTLELIRESQEAALTFLPWSERSWVIRAGYLSGKQVDKSQKLGVTLRPARVLKSTWIPQKASGVFELVTRELPEAGDHALFIGDVVHAEAFGEARDNPILFLGYRNFATLGERWRFKP